jgi:hypothetical protein
MRSAVVWNSLVKVLTTPVHPQLTATARPGEATLPHHAGGHGRPVCGLGPHLPPGVRAGKTPEAGPSPELQGEGGWGWRKKSRHS